MSIEDLVYNVTVRSMGIFENGSIGVLPIKSRPFGRLMRSSVGRLPNYECLGFRGILRTVYRMNLDWRSMDSG